MRRTVEQTYRLTQAAHEYVRRMVEDERWSEGDDICFGVETAVSDKSNPVISVFHIVLPFLLGLARTDQYGPASVAIFALTNPHCPEEYLREAMLLEPYMPFARMNPNTPEDALIAGWLAHGGVH